jgi:hypothetical protein
MSAFPEFGTVGNDAELAAYIDRMPGGDTVGDWRSQPLVAVVVTSDENEKAMLRMWPLTAIVAAYPPISADAVYVFVVPALVGKLLTWYSGEHMWNAYHDPVDVPDTVTAADLDRVLRRWSAIYDGDLDAADDRVVRWLFDDDDPSSALTVAFAGLAAGLPDEDWPLFEQLAADADQSLPDLFERLLLTAQTAISLRPPV